MPRSTPLRHLICRAYQLCMLKSKFDAATLANLRHDIKMVIWRIINQLVLPNELTLEEIDMMSCHIRIYAGLKGQTKARNTWEAYQSGSFWSFFMEKGGDECPKPLLKRILYSSLNGVSLTSQMGAISLSIKEAHQTSPSIDLIGF
ncbi:hypothetical protein GOP47_0006167 [Adiantum capillus-veneris]|uniref:Uncharacterized protein n=1 Tax=Adiantum capillus-veneris TaxID=13818 RepID=A0A9D4V2C6_ADICA|nr:hypothetical protein GOP47_0006167 [Adiantum capillus-veneris]